MDNNISTCSNELVDNFRLNDLLEYQRKLENLPLPIVGLTVSYSFFSVLQDLEEANLLKDTGIFIGLPELEEDE